MFVIIYLKKQISEITMKNGWCSFCANRNLCNNNDCKLCFEKTFASHEKSEYWSEKNGDVKPINVFKSSNKKYLFDCNVCNHSFDSALDKISRGSWCPYCSNNQLCEVNECNVCFEKSFASNEKAKYWSDNNDIKPRNIFKNTHQNYIFNCNICNHNFSANIKSIKLENCWCPYCANKQLCNNDNCNICFEKSFASHEKAK